MHISYFKYLMILLGCLVLSGCATLGGPKKEPLTIEEIVAMAQAGKSDQEIIDQIHETDSVFFLDSDQVLELRNQGLSGALVDEMMQTGIQDKVMDARRQERFDWMMRTPTPMRYGAYPYYYPYWYDPWFDLYPYHRLKPAQKP
jgi:hypothetical protein